MATRSRGVLPLSDQLMLVLLVSVTLLARGVAAGDTDTNPGSVLESHKLRSLLEWYCAQTISPERCDFAQRALVRIEGEGRELAENFINVFSAYLHNSQSEEKFVEIITEYQKRYSGNPEDYEDPLTIAAGQEQYALLDMATEWEGKRETFAATPCEPGKAARDCGDSIWISCCPSYGPDQVMGAFRCSGGLEVDCAIHGPFRSPPEEEVKQTGREEPLDVRDVARKAGFECASFEVRDQMMCGTCWSMAASTVYSQRLCLQTHGKGNTIISTAELQKRQYGVGEGTLEDFTREFYPETASVDIRSMAAEAKKRWNRVFVPKTISATDAEKPKGGIRGTGVVSVGLVQIEEEAVSKSRGWECKQCGSELPADSDFCWACEDYRTDASPDGQRDWSVLCEDCGNEIPADARFCHECGHKAMKTCLECDADSPNNANFCGGCGAKFKEWCTECGELIPLDAQFCSECGEHISQKKTPPPVPPPPLGGFKKKPPPVPPPPSAKAMARFERMRRGKFSEFTRFADQGSHSIRAIESMVNRPVMPEICMPYTCKHLTTGVRHALAVFLHQHKHRRSWLDDEIMNKADPYNDLEPAKARWALLKGRYGPGRFRSNAEEEEEFEETLRLLGGGGVKIRRPSGELAAQCAEAVPYATEPTPSVEWRFATEYKTSVERLMAEVRTNGPVAVEINGDLYENVANSSEEISDKTYSLRRGRVLAPIRPLPPIDHVVVLIGWGTDEDGGGDYYLLQNSYGPNWPKSSAWGLGDGTFRVRRGFSPRCFDESAEGVCELDFFFAQYGTRELLGHEGMIVAPVIAHSTLDAVEKAAAAPGQACLHNSERLLTGKCMCPKWRGGPGCSQCVHDCGPWGEVDAESCACICSKGFVGDDCEVSDADEMPEVD